MVLAALSGNSASTSGWNPEPQLRTAPAGELHSAGQQKQNDSNGEEDGKDGGQAAAAP